MRSIASPHSAPPDRFQRLKHKQYGHARQRRDSQKHRFHRCETEEIASGLPEQRGPHRPQHELLIHMEDPSIVYRVTLRVPSRPYGEGFFHLVPGPRRRAGNWNRS